MVKKELVKGTMLTALAALGISMSLSSGEFEVTAYAADNPAVVSAVGSSEETLRVMHDTYSQEEEPGDDELSMEQYIAGLTTTADAGGWRIEDGVPYWYENGVKQGTEGRGKEIYDPGSNAWYWLDAVDGGRMAVSKDVYQESAAGQWGAIESESGERVGKWVRYDADGHMVKGWQTTEAGTYFFDYTYGTMAKGGKVIDGVSYHFDETTGILISKEEHVHKYISAVTKAATCAEEGVTTYTCSCGHGYTEPIAKTAHSFGEYVYNNDATTEADGTKTRTCSVCGTSETVTAEGTKKSLPSWYDEHPDIPLNQTRGCQDDGSLEAYWISGQFDWNGASMGSDAFGYSTTYDFIGEYLEGDIYYGHIY